jgi:hypothetical protein
MSLKQFLDLPRNRAHNEDMNNHSNQIDTIEEAATALGVVTDYLTELAEGLANPLRPIDMPVTSIYSHRLAFRKGNQLANIYGERPVGTTYDLEALVAAVAPIIADDLAYDPDDDIEDWS